MAKVSYWGIIVEIDSAEDIVVRRIKKAANEIANEATNELDKRLAAGEYADCAYDALTSWLSAQIEAARRANDAFYRCLIRRRLAAIKSGGLNYARQCTARYLNKEVERQGR